MDSVLTDKLRGKFIVFDGPDGCGKTTQLDRLADALTAAGEDVIRTNDPGGTDIGTKIRHLLLGYDLHSMDVRCETLLFMASRAQLVAEIVSPALKAGRTVLCDRFISSTCAYQGAGGYDPHEVIRLGVAAVGDVWPHITCVLDIPPEEGFKRTQRRPSQAGKNRKHSQQGEQLLLIPGVGTDAMEARPLAFHRKVRELFLTLPAIYPKPVIIVDARGSVDEVHERLIEGLGHADF